MNNLINVTNENGKLLVSSREIATNFEKDHWIVTRAIENLTQQNCGVKDMVVETTYTHRGNDYKEYLLTRDSFSLLVMGFTGSKALEWKLKYIEAFNKMEEVLKQQTQVPQTYAQALLEAGRLALENEQLQLEVSEKQNIIDTVIDDDQLFSVGTVGKVLKSYCNVMGAIKIFAYLRDEKILIDSERTQKHNTPYDKYSKYFELKYVDSAFGTHVKPYLNGKGLKWFLNKLAKDNILTSTQREELNDKF